MDYPWLTLPGCVRIPVFKSDSCISFREETFRFTATFRQVVLNLLYCIHVKTIPSKAILSPTNLHAIFLHWPLHGCGNSPEVCLWAADSIGTLTGILIEGSVCGHDTQRMHRVQGWESTVNFPAWGVSFSSPWWFNMTDLWDMKEQIFSALRCLWRSAGFISIL